MKRSLLLLAVLQIFVWSSVWAQSLPNLPPDTLVDEALYEYDVDRAKQIVKNAQELSRYYEWRINTCREESPHRRSVFFTVNICSFIRGWFSKEIIKIDEDIAFMRDLRSQYPNDFEHARAIIAEFEDVYGTTLFYKPLN